MNLDELKDEALKDPEVKREYDELDLLLPDEMEFNYDNVFTVEDDIYTIRKDAYKQGKKDYLTGKYNPPTNYESEIHYQCGWASAEWEENYNEETS